MISYYPTSVKQRVTSPLIGDMVPMFVKETFPNFRKFIEGYISWSEENGNPMHLLGLLKTARDIDLTADQFVVHLAREFAPSLAENRFLYDSEKATYNAADWTFLKYIGEYYRVKGTSKSYEYFFRLLYNLETEVVHPKHHLFRPSDGYWVNPYKFFIEVPIGQLDSDSYTNLYIPVQYTIDNGSSFVSVGVADVLRVVNRSTTTLTLEFEFASFDDQLFSIGDPNIKLKIDDIDVDSALINTDLTQIKSIISTNTLYVPLKVLNKIKVINGGSNWQVGERIILQGDSPTTIEVNSISQAVGGSIYNKPICKSTGISDIFLNVTCVTDVSNSTQWTTTTPYSIGDLVIYDGNYFKVNSNIISSSPPTIDPSYDPIDVLIPTINGVTVYNDEYFLLINQVPNINSVSNGLYQIKYTNNGKCLLNKVATVVNDVVFDSTNKVYYRCISNQNNLDYANSNQNVFNELAVGVGGKISGITIIESGYSSIDYSLITPIKLTTNGIFENITYITGVFCRGFGYMKEQWSSSSDKNIVLEDNYFYQNHSYVVEIKEQFPDEFNVEEYIKTNHPSGFQYFFLETPYSGSKIRDYNSLCATVCERISENGSETCSPDNTPTVIPYLNDELQFGVELPQYIKYRTDIVFEENVKINSWVTLRQFSISTQVNQSSNVLVGINSWITLRAFTTT